MPIPKNYCRAFRIALFLFSAALAGMPTVALADCGPPPNNGFGANYPSYAAWCTQCGGRPYNNRGVGCDMSGASSGGPSYQAPQVGGVKGAVLKGMQQGIQQGIQNAIQQRQQIEAEQIQRQQRENDRASQKMIQDSAEIDKDTRDKSRLIEEKKRISAMKTKQSDGQRVDDILSQMRGGFETGSGSQPKDLSRRPDSETGIPQQKVSSGTMDCAQRKIIRDRLVAGLPVQLENIKRTEEQLKEAKKGVKEATAERNAVLIKGALEEVKAYTHGLLKTTDALRGQIEVFQGLDRAKRDLLIKTLHTIAFSAEDLYNSRKAGREAAVEAQKGMQNLVDKIKTFNKFMVDSGITDEASGEFLGELAGPWGEFGFRASKIAIDLSAAVWAGNISKEEQEAAQKNLYIMEQQHQRVKQQITDIDRELGTLCTGQAWQ